MISIFIQGLSKIADCYFAQKCFAPQYSHPAVRLLVEDAERSIFVPLSFAIPLGLIIALVGIILYFVTSYKRAAKMMISVGLVIAIFTFVAVLLASRSPM